MDNPNPMDEQNNIDQTLEAESAEAPIDLNDLDAATEPQSPEAEPAEANEDNETV